MGMRRVMVFMPMVMVTPVVMNMVVVMAMVVIMVMRVVNMVMAVVIMMLVTIRFVGIRADALDMVVMALLRQAHLRLEAQHLGAVLA